MNAEQLTGIILSGIAATAALDAWQRLVHRLGGYPPSNWAMVGRWLAVLVRRGVIFNDRLTKTEPVAREGLMGWSLHYVVGIGYAALYWYAWQHGELLQANWQHGLLAGVLSVVVPWFFFMPAMGAGVLARHAPSPTRTCLFALAGHTVFGAAMGAALGATLA